MNDFMRVFAFFAHSDLKIKTLSMFIISELSDSRIQEAYAYSVNSGLLNASHEKGLLSLIHVNTLTASDITAMIGSDDSVIRKYGIIAASRVSETHPEIIRESVNSKNPDIQVFSKAQLQAKAKIAALRNRNKRISSRTNPVTIWDISLCGEREQREE